MPSGSPERARLPALDHVVVRLDLVAFDDTHAIFEPMPDSSGPDFHAQLTIGQGHWLDLGSPRRIKITAKEA